MGIPQLNTIFFLTGTWQGALVPDKPPQSFLWQATTSSHPEPGNNFPQGLCSLESCGSEALCPFLQDAAQEPPAPTNAWPEPPLPLGKEKHKSNLFWLLNAKQKTVTKMKSVEQKINIYVEHRMIMGYWTDFLLQTSVSCLDRGAISANILPSLFLLWKKKLLPWFMVF